VLQNEKLSLAPLILILSFPGEAEEEVVVLWALWMERVG
jgi:hypothetical protein